MEDSRFESASRTRAWFFPLLATLIALAGALLAVEAGLRAYHYVRGTYRLDEEAAEARRNSIWMRSDDPVLMFVHRPDYRKGGIRYTESHGILRSDDVPEEKPAGTLRIALLGDSIGAGLTLAYAERFPSLLEQKLDAVHDRRVEVLNFSVNGYKTAQEARLLEAVVSGFDIDVLVVAYCMNDVANSLTPTRWFLDPSPPRSYLWAWVAARLNPSRRTPYVPVFGPDYAHGPYKYWHQLYAQESEGWRSVMEGFDRIAWFASERSCPVLLVIFPFFLPSDWRAGGVVPLYEQVSAAARRRGFEVLDLLPVFEVCDVADVRKSSDDIFHPNARGHEIAAAAIGEKLREMLDGE